LVTRQVQAHDCLQLQRLKKLEEFYSLSLLNACPYFTRPSHHFNSYFPACHFLELCSHSFFLDFQSGALFQIALKKIEVPNLIRFLHCYSVPKSQNLLIFSTSLISLFQKSLFLLFLFPNSPFKFFPCANFFLYPTLIFLPSPSLFLPSPTSPFIHSFTSSFLPSPICPFLLTFTSITSPFIPSYSASFLPINISAAPFQLAFTSPARYLFSLITSHQLITSLPSLFPAFRFSLIPAFHRSFAVPLPSTCSTLPAKASA